MALKLEQWTSGTNDIQIHSDFSYLVRTTSLIMHCFQNTFSF